MKMDVPLCGVLCALLSGFVLSQKGFAMKSIEIPSQPASDQVMATSQELEDMLDWTGLAFTGQRRLGSTPRIQVEVRRQDHNVLAFRESCMQSPLKIGKKQFDRGLGTHAVSEIAISVPEKAKRFEAMIGVDNNEDTQGSKGSVIFIVLVKGGEAYRSTVLRGGGDPVPVRVDLPPDTGEIVLRVDATEDGTGWDQADWAEACFILEDGSQVWIDENQRQSLFLNEHPPFSFLYDGIPSQTFLATWERTTASEDHKDRIVDRIQWTDPKTGLCVSTDVTTYKDFPAADWVLRMENRGQTDTPLIQDIQSLDVLLRTGLATQHALIHQLEGDACGETSFLPKATRLEAGKDLRWAPTGGRSSSISAFPFFNLEYRDQGLIIAIGWTGQWAAELNRKPTGLSRLRAGMEKTHLVLHPGETLRGPRILLMSWKKDRLAAHNRFRRLMLFKIVPQVENRPCPMPVALQTFDRYNARPGWATEAGQLEAVRVAHELGCNTYWLDAAWFPKGFPNGVGSWFCDPTRFPRGLKPVSDLCHERGMKFVLWFEPERVAQESQIAEEHPEFVFGGREGGLFKLNDPVARRWLTDLLSQRIAEYGIDIYRNDFNMDPLGYWRGHDAEDRQGMTEIRYIEGLYEMWDELLERHPGLMIDNCSSGGRRIDLEMCSRSVPLWRSDTHCSPGRADWSQAQTLGINLYVPLNTACSWMPSFYETRSAQTSGLLCQWTYLERDFALKEAQACVAEGLANRGYWYGDFYPLSRSTGDPEDFVAYQLHRPDLDAGMVMGFRHSECEWAGVILGLRGIRAQATYRLEMTDEQGKKTETKMSGEELQSNLEIRVRDKRQSLLIRYEIED